jgi:DNA polymerase V
MLSSTPKSPHPVLSLALYSCKIPAGFPSPASDYIDQRLDLNEYLAVNPEATFFLRVQGNSMTGAGIHDGDLLVVDRSLQAKSGNVVIAVVDGEFTVKRLQHLKGKVWLKAENPSYPNIELQEGQELEIWGVVSHVVHRP